MVFDPLSLLFDSGFKPPWKLISIIVVGRRGVGGVNFFLLWIVILRQLVRDLSKGWQKHFDTFPILFPILRLRERGGRFWLAFYLFVPLMPKSCELSLLFNLCSLPLCYSSNPPSFSLQLTQMASVVLTLFFVDKAVCVARGVLH